MKDGHYGLGGTTFWSKGGAETHDLHAQGRALADQVSRFELWYLARPGRWSPQGQGGRRGAPRPSIPAPRSSRIASTRSTWSPVPHKISRARGGPRERAGLRGSCSKTTARASSGISSASSASLHEEACWPGTGSTSPARSPTAIPDLIVFTYGGNDHAPRGQRQAHQIEAYVRGVQRTWISSHAQGQARGLLPGHLDDRSRASSLKIEITPEHVETIVTGPARGRRQGPAAPSSTPIRPWVGGGSLEDWKNRKPPLAAKDLKHLNHRGRVLLGRLDVRRDHGRLRRPPHADPLPRRSA